MVLVPSGDFIMGEERKVVHVNEFYIDKFPITNPQYKSLLIPQEPKSPFSGITSDLINRYNQL